MRRSCSRNTKWESLTRLRWVSIRIKWGVISMELSFLSSHQTEMSQTSTKFSWTWFHDVMWPRCGESCSCHVERQLIQFDSGFSSFRHIQLSSVSLDSSRRKSGSLNQWREMRELRSHNMKSENCSSELSCYKPLRIQTWTTQWPIHDSSSKNINLEHS